MIKLADMEDIVCELETLVSHESEQSDSSCDCESSCGCTDQCTRTCSWREYGR